MLVTSKQIFQVAQEKGFAFPAPNFIDQLSIASYIEVAEKRKIPMLLSFAQVHQEFLSLEEAACLGRFYGERTKMPMVLHLDHGQDLDTIMRAIELGFTSVMIDASMENLEENIRRTKEVVKYAHQRGVVVEAEIGHVGSGENYESHTVTDSIYTSPAEAKYFADKTQVDSLAISIGTAHGSYKAEPKIQFDVLQQIRQSVTIPLVLHGGSSSGDDNLRRCAREGISKVNVFTDLMNAAGQAVKNQEVQNYIEVKDLSRQGIIRCLEHFCDILEVDKYGRA
ncbi:class II fructose-bisphosphate aldolase [Clostridiales bacterium COT073_COT-073]|nr:class II fructose-bisphosphate aldolase [Clostridiales bacterium COT073_COT-073]